MDDEIRKVGGLIKANEAAKANVQRAKQVGGSGLLIDCE